MPEYWDADKFNHACPFIFHGGIKLQNIHALRTLIVIFVWLKHMNGQAGDGIKLSSYFTIFTAVTVDCNSSMKTVGLVIAMVTNTTMTSGSSCKLFSFSYSQPGATSYPEVHISCDSHTASQNICLSGITYFLIVAPLPKKTSLYSCINLLKILGGSRILHHAQRVSRFLSLNFPRNTFWISMGLCLGTKDTFSHPSPIPCHSDCESAIPSCSFPWYSWDVVPLANFCAYCGAPDIVGVAFGLLSSYALFFLSKTMKTKFINIEL